MNLLRTAALACLLSAALAPFAFAQDTRESAIASMRKVEPKEMDASYHKTAPMAQKLVDEALAQHPEVILMAIHGGAPKYDIIASNFGRVGKLGDEDDLRCIHTGKSNLEVDKTGKHFEVELPLKDKAGRTIGALGVVFNYKPGDDKAAAEAVSKDIAMKMSKQLDSSNSLFAPAS